MEYQSANEFTKTVEADSPDIPQYHYLMQEGISVWVGQHGLSRVVGMSLPYNCNGVMLIDVDFKGLSHAS